MKKYFSRKRVNAWLDKSSMYLNEILITNDFDIEKIRSVMFLLELIQEEINGSYE